MKKVDYILTAILVILIILLIGLRRCEKRVEGVSTDNSKTVIDSLNAEYDHLEAYYSNKLINLYDTIEIYKSALKSKKTVFKERYKTEYIKDTVYQDLDYRQCCEDANEIIMQEDSLITYYDTSLAVAKKEIVNLKKQVLGNRVFIKEIKVENPKIKKQRNWSLAISVLLLGILAVK